MSRRTLIAWLPIMMLPTAAVIVTPEGWPRWAFMWVFAFAIFAGCKWLTWYTAAPTGASIFLQVRYLAAWPGLDADTFLRTTDSRPPRWRAWTFALAKFALGVGLTFGVYPCVPSDLDLVRGWVGMVGIIFVLHFGIFHLLSLAWQSAGVRAKPIMDWPILATSVSAFWGQRWNLAFRDLTHRILFRPLTARCGARVALVIGFLFSGIVHDLVISLPAQSGWGGPTVYFLLQAAAIFFERSAFGRKLKLTRGWCGWAFAMLVLVGPVMLLFHPPFVRGVVVPFLDWINSGA